MLDAPLTGLYDPQSEHQSIERVIMADEQNEGQQQSQQSVQVLLDERDLKSMYSNAYRIHNTMEEVVVDLGFNMPNPNPQTGQQQLLFKVTDRVIMTYSNAKRLTMSLTQLIKRYEQQFGEIPVAGQQRK